MDFYDGRNVAILLYAASKYKFQGQTLFKRFPSLQHITHEVFLFAQFNDYLNAYEFKKGKYMPESALVESGIKEHFIYNPIMDAYEFKGEWDTLLEAGQYIEKLPDKQADKLMEIRRTCEWYTAQQLYLMLHKIELDYIENRVISDEFRSKITGVLGYMFYEGGYYKDAKLTESAFDKLMKDFEISYAYK